MLCRLSSVIAVIGLIAVLLSTCDAFVLLSLHNHHHHGRAACESSLPSSFVSASTNLRSSFVALQSSASSTSSSSITYNNVILYDGVCNFCNAWVDILLKVDGGSSPKFRFAALQSEVGMKLLEGVGKDANDISSVMLIKNSGTGTLEGFQKSDCILEVVKELGIPATGFVAGWLAGAMPRTVKDGLYDTVARNRYNFMGKRTTFERINDQRDKARFLND